MVKEWGLIFEGIVWVIKMFGDKGGGGGELEEGWGGGDCVWGECCGEEGVERELL